MRYTINKNERLKSQKAIDDLFESGESMRIAPLRIKFQLVERTDGMLPVQLMVVVRKRLFRHACDRNRIKRLMREAFRLNKQALYENLQSTQTLRLALIQNKSSMPTYNEIEQSVKEALKQLIDNMLK